MRFHRYTRTLLVTSGMVLLAPVASAEQEKIPAPHVHGIGNLTVVIEGNDIRMELAVPGMDIVGFEHVADTARQRRAVKAALADLREPLSLFQLPDPAGCAVTSADVELVMDIDVQEVGEAEAEKAAELGGIEEADLDEPDDEENDHSEFRAVYTLTCKDASLVQAINFRFFDRFRDAHDLNVTLIDAAGESSFAVSRNFRYMER